MATTSRRKLDGKVAVITASTAGIGYAIAEGLAENGAKVVISSRRENNVDDAVRKLCSKGLTVSGIVCHVAQDKDRKKLIQKAIDDYGQLDILVSNAAVNPTYGPIFETSESAWDKIFDVNLKSAFLLAKEAAPYLERAMGSMLFISSVGAYNPLPASPQVVGAYSVSKTALLGLVKVLAAECAPHVRVNGIAPGVIETNFSAVLTNSKYANMALNNIPLKRFGQPTECAGVAVFLSSDDASYITGDILMVTGGMASRI